ncbi:hypothetical protein LEMA_P056040.1 [Plenodomus lingam JN3]|uniref:PNPLA domain-containing protein n=1 Tax=Leptosphaeria maculans (strain JN3 / isolate v23.1.3 / race Av1-4-5-6-7-8) TaxID=985895 RepID=E4ZMM9_LEPMJ|nr:hypothetical protein LEMA_P056040.1 [Plenodomus lingam JN3]CBX92898.1 hypothetical protein LEMA_P056040.1 [Plenodomus lingam JN3]
MVNDSWVRILVTLVWFLSAGIHQLWCWLWSPSTTTKCLASMASAQTYKEWQEAANMLDKHLAYDAWRQSNYSKYYDYRMIQSRHNLLVDAQNDPEGIDIHTLINLVQTGLIRNLGNIANPKLYNRAFYGTKRIIGEYMLQVIGAINIIEKYPTSKNGYTDSQKESTITSFKRSFGHSALILQGGAMFGLCHLGVVKALLEQKLLPRCIVGTSTSALVAAFVGVHTREELPGCLTGKNIDLTAFTNRPYRKDTGYLGRLATLVRRLKRWWHVGHFLDLDVLEEMLKANLGNMTFDEAFLRTGTVLNIIITGRNGQPVVLNYLTAPYVFIWSAALASNAAPSNKLDRPITVMCKNYNGAEIPWMHPSMSTFQPPGSRPNHNASPLNEIRVQFNVNHFIISQAQPYIAPLLRTDLHEPNPKHRGLLKVSVILVQEFAREMHHRLRHKPQSGGILSGLACLILDEFVPGLKLTLVPKFQRTDFPKLLDHPTQEVIDYFILKGERSVWPAVKAIKTRCCIEMELFDALERLKRPTPPQPGHGTSTEALSSDTSQEPLGWHLSQGGASSSSSQGRLSGLALAGASISRRSGEGAASQMSAADLETQRNRALYGD